MTEEEAQKVLDELNTVRIEVLNDEAKRLFEAIMKIANERDKIKQEYDRDTHILQNRLDLANAKKIEKDKIIEQQKEQIDYLRRSCDRKEECLIEEQQENAELENKLKEKDKIIDLMAKYIGEIDDETFCDEDKYERDIEDNVIGCDEDCQECVKQYFENKVKEG